MRSIREVKVGDIVGDKMSPEYKVFEVLQNTFSVQENHNSVGEYRWITFEHAEDMGWRIETKEECILKKRLEEIVDGVDDSEEVVKTPFHYTEVLELKRLVDKMEYLLLGVPSAIDMKEFRGTLSVLNKMLKEKE